MATSVHRVSDLEKFEFHWEDADFNKGAFLRPGIHTPFFFQFLTFLRRVHWLKTRLWLTKSKTRIHFHVFQQLQSLKDQPTTLCYWKIAQLEQELRMFVILFMEFCLKKLYCFSVCFFLKTIINVFQFKITFWKTSLTCVGQKYF